MTRTHCDKCGGKIECNGACPCGFWMDNDHKGEMIHALENVVRLYDENDYEHPLSGDHFTGVCFVIFRGDYEKARKVQAYVEHLDEHEEGR